MGTNFKSLEKFFIVKVAFFIMTPKDGFQIPFRRHVLAFQGLETWHRNLCLPFPGGYGADAGAQASYGAGDDPAAAELAALAANIPGVPGEDYPIFAEVPETGFSCEGQVPGGE